MNFDIDAHRGCFNTSQDEACFWHGQTNGCGGQNNAMAIAAENNSKTLEMCMLEHRDELEGAGVRFKDNDDGTVSIDYGNTRTESQQFWEDCSQAFAEQASGNIHVIKGADPRPNGQSESDYPSVYNRIEYPALEQNQQVSSITHIDPYTHQQTGYEAFDRNQSTASGVASDASGNSGASFFGAPQSNPLQFGELPPPREESPKQEPLINGTLPEQPARSEPPRRSSHPPFGQLPESNASDKGPSPQKEQGASDPSWNVNSNTTEPGSNPAESSTTYPLGAADNATPPSDSSHGSEKPTVESGMDAGIGD